MPLTDAAVRNLKPGDKPRKVTDADGLHAFVTTTGSILWRMAYRFDGKQKQLALGRYPEVSLREARQRKEEARRLLAQGKDPAAVRKNEKAETAAQAKAESLTFAKVAREWYERRTIDFSEKHRKVVLSRLENQLFPYIGSIPISDLEPGHILEAVSRAETRGACVVASKLNTVHITIIGLGWSLQ